MTLSAILEPSCTVRNTAWRTINGTPLKAKRSRQHYGKFEVSFHIHRRNEFSHSS